MGKDKKITLYDIYQRVRRSWTRDSQTQIRKNKKQKSRQQQKIDLRKELD